LLLLVTLLGVIAVMLFKYFGWKGMMAFPLIVVALIWVGKFAIGKLIQQFASGLFSMKSGALKDATVAVHSIVPVTKPPEVEEEDENEDEDEEAEDKEEGTEGTEEEEEEEDEEEDKPRAYYEVDLTITPKDGNKERFWEPGEFVLVSEPVKKLMDIEEKEVGSMHKIEIWDGGNFTADDPGKYPGEQRLKLTVSVEPGASRAWLQYYDVSLAALELPAWQPK
jgi:hypothetical protein